MERESVFSRLIVTGTRVGVFLLLVVAAQLAAWWLLAGFGELLILAAGGSALAGILSNGGCLAIFERLGPAAIGLSFDRAALRNLGLGLAGGVCAGLLVIGLPMLGGMATFTYAGGPAPEVALSRILLLAAGAMGEELVFRGYAFQLLMARAGPFTTILPFSMIFAIMHAGNPGASAISITNTALWGVVLGVALWRSGGLWLPFGLHFGWNALLPLLGVPLSGLTIKLTGVSVAWQAPIFLSGGNYGPEASILTSGAALLLLVFLWKGPVFERRLVLLERYGEE